MSLKCFRFILLFIAILCIGCFSYYNRNHKLNTAFESKNYKEAQDILSSKKWEKKQHNILLYYLNKGMVLHKLGLYKESNEYFQKADYFIEDFREKYWLSAASLAVNATVKPYGGENHEKILLHYFTTLNYLLLNDFEGALIECKRMNIKMENISSYYKNNNKYHRDAFAHLLTGLVYEAQKDYNNAFIAYRNAYDIYKNEYVTLLNEQIPQQLKLDILRTAALSGFSSEVLYYEKEFGIKNNPEYNQSSFFVGFSNEGLCPVKQKFDLDFLITKDKNGNMLFANLETGLIIPVALGNNQNKENDLLKLKVIRISIPKYVSRTEENRNLSLKLNNTTYSVETVENIDAIAHQSLKDRMIKELGETLLRFALKRIAEQKASQSSEGLELALNVLNTITEQADTRNWQLLPHSIKYVKIPVNNSKNQIIVSTQKSISDTLSVTIKNKGALFFDLSALNYR